MNSKWWLCPKSKISSGYPVDLTVPRHEGGYRCASFDRDILPCMDFLSDSGYLWLDSQFRISLWQVLKAPRDTMQEHLPLQHSPSIPCFSEARTLGFTSDACQWAGGI